MTRSSSLDYRWLGGAPVEWWSEPSWGSSLLRNVQPSLLIQSETDGRGVYLTGIQSTRRDVNAGTRIRYEIALVPSSTENSVLTPGEAAKLVRRWWADRGTAPADAWVLGTDIDSAFATLSDTNATLALDALIETGAQAGETLQVLRAALKAPEPQVPLTLPVETDTTRVDWIGADNSHVSALLDSAFTGDQVKRSVAYFGSIDASIVAGSGRTGFPEGAILLVDGDSGWHDPKDQGVQIPAPAPSLPARPRGRSCGLMTGAAALMTIVTAILLILL